MRNDLIFQHDGGLPHCAALAPIEWPATLSDLSPLIFSLSGYFKSKVYVISTENLANLQARIRHEIHHIPPL